MDEHIDLVLEDVGVGVMAQHIGRAVGGCVGFRGFVRNVEVGELMRQPCCLHRRGRIALGVCAGAGAGGRGLRELWWGEFSVSLHLHELLLHFQDTVQGDVGLSHLVESFDTLRQTLVKHADDGAHELGHGLAEGEFGPRSIDSRMIGVWCVGIMLCFVLIVRGAGLGCVQAFRSCRMLVAGGLDLRGARGRRTLAHNLLFKA